LSSDVRDLFLSHSSANKPDVRKIAAGIKAHQNLDGRPLTVWLDEAEIRPGQSIPGAMNAGLETSRFFGLLMSPAYFESRSGLLSLVLPEAVVEEVRRNLSAKLTEAVPLFTPDRTDRVPGRRLRGGPCQRRVEPSRDDGQSAAGGRDLPARAHAVYGADLTRRAVLIRAVSFFPSEAAADALKAEFRHRQQPGRT